MLEGTLDAGTSIPTGARLANSEIVSRMAPVYLATPSRLNPNVMRTEPLMISNPLNGSDFSPTTPDNVPAGTIMAIKSFSGDTNKNEARIYELSATGGKIVAKPLVMVPERVRRIIETEVTGEALGPYDPPIQLPTLDVGVNIESGNESKTSFQIVKQQNPKRGDDYYTVAVATPGRLRRFGG